jgi:hypothetical protein
MSTVEINAQNNSHIPTSEIERDIADTRREIAQMEEEAVHFEATPRHLTDYRWNQMRAAARHHGISERLVFIDKLEAILTWRRENNVL